MPISTAPTTPSAVSSGTWLQADLGGYYSVSKVQLISTDASASNQTVSLSINDMKASGIGVGHLLGDTTVQNFNTGTLAANSTLTLTPSLATDDSTPTLQGKLASSAALPSGTEYAVYATNLDNATQTKLGVPTLSGSDWSFTPSTALVDGRYAFTLVTQANGNSTFNSATAKSASSIILNIDTANPTLDLNGSTVTGNNTSVDSFIGNRNLITLTGGANASTTAPYVNLPDVSLGNDLTLEAWVNFSTFEGSRVFDIGNGQSADNLILLVDGNGKVTSSIRVGGTPVDVGQANGDTRALVTGQWYHMALVVSGNTQKAFVNGVEWLSGALPAGFASNAPITRTNTWVGRSNFGEPFSNMQVRDVRIYDDARTAAQLSSDMIGTPVDVTDPKLRLAYKLQGDGQSSIPGQAEAELVNISNASDSVFRLAPNAVLSDASPIASIKVTVSGVLDGAAEKLLVDGTALTANGAVTSGTLTACNAQWNWTYAAATGFTFSAVGGGNGNGVPAGLAQALVQSLGYRNTSTTASFGNRGFSISTTDVFGHSSSAATATLQDATLPGISNLPGMAQIASRTANTPLDLADLVFNKGGNTATSATLDVTITATDGTVGGVTDENLAIAGIQISGTPALLGTKFQNATFQANPTGTPGLSLVLSDSTGNTVTLAYPLIADDAAAPVLDLNGAANGNDITVVSNISNKQPINLTGWRSGQCHRTVSGLAGCIAGQ